MHAILKPDKILKMSCKNQVKQRKYQKLMQKNCLLKL